MSAASDTQDVNVGVEQGGSRLFVKNGGVLDIETGGKLEVGGTDITAALASLAALPAGTKISVGPIALDGSNPTSVAPAGWTAAAGGIAILAESSAPGVGTTTITALANGAGVDFYAWKPTSNANPTLIASTGTETIYYVVWGV